MCQYNCDLRNIFFLFFIFFFFWIRHFSNSGMVKSKWANIAKCSGKWVEKFGYARQNNNKLEKHPIQLIWCVLGDVLSTSNTHSSYCMGNSWFVLFLSKYKDYFVQLNGIGYGKKSQQYQKKLNFLNLIECILSTFGRFYRYWLLFLQRGIWDEEKGNFCSIFRLKWNCKNMRRLIVYSSNKQNAN